MSISDLAGPQQIKAFLNRMPEDYRTGFENADGTKTDERTWFEPEEGTLPPPLPQEKFEEAMNMPDDRKEMLRMKMKANPK
jgi:hypothetical protein